MGKSGMIFLLMTLFFATIKRDDAARHANVTADCDRPERCDVDGFNDWLKVGNECVNYFNQKDNFSDAELNCRKQAPGGHLVSVHSEKANHEINCIVKNLNKTDLRIWLGGYEFFQTSKFSWTDGSKWDFDIWTPGEPNNIFRNNEDCVEMNWKDTGKWNDDSCGVKKNYVCAFKRKCKSKLQTYLDTIE
ncbi:C-type lectin lectoxin-Thr1-like [Xyrauchen texanus]|uniref:C-type lectin lectoxin-Thr1-like n=1 Tax=Xyrauchen texanus TaxID=154827 RepID=UPI002241EDD6|nr:C-type lectin lectoxin-Thr1-like [Xyrauchen texanus]